MAGLLPSEGKLRGSPANILGITRATKSVARFSFLRRAHAAIPARRNSSRICIDDARDSDRRTPKSRARDAQETANLCGFARRLSSRARCVARHRLARERARRRCTKIFVARCAHDRRDASRAMMRDENSCAHRRAIERATAIMHIPIRERDRIADERHRARCAMLLRQGERNGLASAIAAARKIGDRPRNRLSPPNPRLAGKWVVADRFCARSSVRNAGRHPFAVARGGRGDRSSSSDHADTDHGRHGSRSTRANEKSRWSPTGSSLRDGEKDQACAWRCACACSTRRFSRRASLESFASDVPRR